MVVIFFLVPYILQEGYRSCRIPFKATHAIIHIPLSKNTLLLSNTKPHRAALKTFINRTMQLKRAIELQDVLWLSGRRQVVLST